MAVPRRRAAPRAILAPWAPLLADPARRKILGRALAALLTREVTARLPDELGFEPGRDDIDAWIDRADGFAGIRTITRSDTGALAGLLLQFPADAPAEAEATELMVGYFLGRAHWGRGLASDMLRALVAEIDQGPPRSLIAGTEADNIASQRVLEKAGFTRNLDAGAPDRIMFSRACGR